MPTPNCGLNTAETNRVKVQYTREDPNCYGALPSTTPRITRIARVKTANFNIEKETAVSEEIRADRMVSSTNALNASSSGEMEFEFARGTVDDFLAAYVGAEDWTKPMWQWVERGEIVSFTANNVLTISGKDYSALIKAGDVIKTEGFKNPENNNYWTVSAVSYTGGNTEITLTTSTAVVEAGNPMSVVMDANDVIVMATSITTDTTGFVASSPLFATAVAAGQLKPGRYLYVHGMGNEKGNVTLSAQPAASETLRVDDGAGNVVTFMFVNAGDATPPGYVGVEIGGTVAETADNLHTAIMEQYVARKLKVSSKRSTSGSDEIVHIKNLNPKGGGSLTGTVATINNFTGGNATVSGVFKILNATDTRIDVSPAPTAFTNPDADMVVIKGSHLAPSDNPNEIKKIAYWIERSHTDVAQHFLFKGQRVESIDLEISTGDLVGGSVSFVGASAQVSQDSTLDKSPDFVVVDALTTPVYNATSNVKSIKKDGATIPGVVTNVKLSMATNLRKQFSVGSYYNRGVGQGRLDITGSLEIYFQDLEWYSAFLNNQYVALEMVFEDADGCGYVVSLPKLFLNKDEVPVDGIDKDVMESVDFTANMDTSLSNTMIVWTRYSSTQTPTT